MNKAPDQTDLAVLSAAPATQHDLARPQNASCSPTEAFVSGAGSAYRLAAMACVPRWLRWMTEATNLCARSHRSRQRTAPAWIHRQQAAALGVVLASTPDVPLAERERTRELVRRSLVLWQRSLREDGRPRLAKARRSQLHGPTLSLVVQLLDEMPGYDTGLLIADIRQHAHWLAATPTGDPWAEATTISALADAALLLRDLSLRERARERLTKLLVRQDDEGWFPERGGADVGRLSLVVDAFARLQKLHKWDELTEPIARALTFLRHFIHPDGSAGGCYSSCGTGFLSPFGVECLRESVEEASILATTCRRYFGAASTRRIEGWHDSLCAWLGPRLLLAANVATESPDRAETMALEKDGRRDFPHAGLSIISTEHYRAIVATKQGGSLHITWHADGKTISEPGICVVFAHHLSTSSRWHARTSVQLLSDRIISSGSIHRPASIGERSVAWWRRLGRYLRKHSGISSGSNDASRKTTPRIDHDKLTRDHFERHIVFAGDVIEIRDIVRCRFPCEVILLPRSDGDGDAPFVDRFTSSALPITFEGSRYVEVSRAYKNGELVER